MRRDMNLAAFVALTSLTSVLAIEDNDAPPTPPDTICGQITNSATSGTLIEASLDAPS